MQVEVLPCRDCRAVGAGEGRVYTQPLCIGAHQEACCLKDISKPALGEVANVALDRVHRSPSPRPVVRAEAKGGEQHLVGFAEHDGVARIVKVSVVVDPLLADLGRIPRERGQRLPAISSSMNLPTVRTMSRDRTM